MSFVKSSLIALVLALTVFGLASANYSGPNRTVTTSTWTRQYCNYRATVVSPAGSCLLTLYFSPGSCPSTSSVAGFFNNAQTACGTAWPGTCGSGLACSITFLTGSAQNCSSGEIGCTLTTSSTTYPPATVGGSTVCAIPGENGWCKGAATINLSGSEPLSGYSITGIEGSAGILCGGPACVWTFPEGATNLSFWALSSWGDTSLMSSAASMVDSVAPALSLSIPPADGSNGWYRLPVTLTASGSDATSGLAAMQVRLDGGPWTPGSSLNVPDGVHALEFQASDVAGNLTSESYSISVDSTPPTLTVSLPVPQGTDGWYTSGVQFQAAGNDAISGIQDVAYSLDGAATWQAGSLTLVEGRYTIITRVADLAGNVTTLTNTVNVDPTPPQSIFTSPAEGSTTVIHGSLTMNGQTLDGTSGPSAAAISMDGGTTWQPMAIADGTWSSSWDTNTVPNGTYLIQVRASDLAGNQEHTARITVVVAKPGPEVTITETWWLWEQAEIRIQGSLLPVTGARIEISDGQGHTRTYTFNAAGLPRSLQWDGVWSDGLPAPPGDFAVVITAWDAFGNTGQDTGTVRVPGPLASPTREPPAVPAAASELSPPAEVASAPTIVPQVVPPAPASGPSKIERLLMAPVIDPVYLWPVLSLVGLLAALASSSWSDKRPSALHRLEKMLTTSASGSEETRKSHTRR